MDAIILGVVLFFCLMLLAFVAYIVGRSSRISRLEKDVEELKKKEEIGKNKIDEFREFAIEARGEIKALNEGVKQIKDGFKEQSELRRQFLKDIKELIPISIENALAPIRIEMRHIQESVATLQKKNE